tara:strand:- start:380 stop:772 length:393 start_codon:yes stop_codon:yes gene_type:complete
MKSKSKGLGDTIAKVTKATGVEKIVKTFFGDDCGCDKRQERLNKMFPYRTINDMTQQQIKFFQDVLQPAYRHGVLGKENRKEFYALYESVFQKKMKQTSCSSCNKNMYVELLKVYEASCNKNIDDGTQKS